jgi:hypothetical protein
MITYLVGGHEDLWKAPGINDISMYNLTNGKKKYDIWIAFSKSNWIKTHLFFSIWAWITLSLLCRRPLTPNLGGRDGWSRDEMVTQVPIKAFKIPGSRVIRWKPLAVVSQTPTCPFSVNGHELRSPHLKTHPLDVSTKTPFPVINPLRWI